MYFSECLLCQKVIDIAPQDAPKRGPKPKPWLKAQYDQALAALGRIEKQEGEYYAIRTFYMLITRRLHPPHAFGKGD